MNLPTLWCYELKIKIIVDILTHIKSKNFMIEYYWKINRISMLFMVNKYKNVNFATMCINITHLIEKIVEN